jgi:hypothetical protein
MYSLTNHQARQFILVKQGLLGEHRFVGKSGAMEYIRQAGCLQFDPVDVCGKNAEILLHARVKGFTKKMLHDLLYTDRLLVDYPDKQLAIVPTVYWPYFERYRKAAREHSQRFEGLNRLEEQCFAYIEANGPVSSGELPIEGKIRWNSAIHWSGAWSGETNAARAVLEQLYSSGDLIIHHKKGTRKYYDLATRHIPEEIRTAPDPLPDDYDHIKWRILRRIGAIGLLWNRPSDAWLGIWGFNNDIRKDIFETLKKSEDIIPVVVEGINTPLYCQKQDEGLLHTVLRNPVYKPRMEFLSPLDCLMWDRKLILSLFGFQYAWEIYTPPQKRKYGPYVLPLLYGDSFIGRVEPGKNIWYEDGVKPTKKQLSALDNCLKRFAKFNYRSSSFNDPMSEQSMDREFNT